VALLSNLVKPILPYIPGAPSIVVERQYLRAARDFLTRTRAYVRDDLAPVVSVAEQAVYALPIDNNEEVFDLLDLWYAGTYRVHKETRRKSRDRLLTTPGIPAYFTVPIPGQLTVSPAPREADQEFTYLACMRPTMVADELADSVVGKYMEVLEHGAVAYSLRQPNQEWTDYKGAGVYQTLFDDAVDAHRSSAVDEEQRGVIRTVKYGGYPAQ
jgi:hypothetical protein